MKQTVNDAIHILIKKATEYGTADDILKVSQAALCLANAAETLENLEAPPAPDETPDPKPKTTKTKKAAAE